MRPRPRPKPSCARCSIRCRCSTPARAVPPTASSSAALATCCSPGKTRRGSHARNSAPTTSRSSIRRSAFSPNRRCAWWTRSWTRRARARWREAYLEFLYTQPGPGYRSAATITGPAIQRWRAQYAERYPALNLATDQGLRRLGRRPGDVFRRWRHVRPHLHAGKMMLTARRSASAGLRPDLRDHARSGCR